MLTSSPLFGSDSESIRVLPPVEMTVLILDHSWVFTLHPLVTRPAAEEVRDLVSVTVTFSWIWRQRSVTDEPEYHSIQSLQ
jgi:hypothetical protein